MDIPPEDISMAHVFDFLGNFGTGLQALVRRLDKETKSVRFQVPIAEIREIPNRRNRIVTKPKKV